MSDIRRAVGATTRRAIAPAAHVVEPKTDGETAMPFDLRRCAEAAVHVPRLSRAFAPPSSELGVGGAPLLGPDAAAVVCRRRAPATRSGEAQGTVSMVSRGASRFQELLDEIVLEADVVPDPDDQRGATRC